MKILLINDGTAISSAFVYKRLKDYGTIDTERIIKGLEEGKTEVIKDFRNVMEDVIYDNFPHLLDIRNRLLDLGAENALVSGSGASIFAVFLEDKALEKAYHTLKYDYQRVLKVGLVDD